jgi:esterase
MVTEVKPRDKFADVSGLKLHYLEWGTEGSPKMLLVHGMTGNGHAWDTFARSLMDEYHILALDLRGHGDSEWSKEQAYKTKDLVAEIDGFVDGLSLDRFVYVGHSMGAHNGLGYASMRPDKVEKLVMVDYAPARENPITQPAAPAPDSFSSIDEVVASYQQNNRTTPPETLRQRATWSTRRGDDGMYRFKHDPAVRINWDSEDLWGIVSKVSSPTLLMRGGESTSISQEYALKAVKALPKGQFVEIPGAGHSIMLDQPKAFEDAVRSFLSQ